MTDNQFARLLGAALLAVALIACDDDEEEWTCIVTSESVIGERATGTGTGGSRLSALREAEEDACEKLGISLTTGACTPGGNVAEDCHVVGGGSPTSPSP